MRAQLPLAKLIFVSAALVLMCLAGCAAGPNPVENTAGAEGGVAGFWLGLWHGFIVFFALVVSFFTDAVGIYEVHNSGAAYDIGFFLGAAMALGGGTHASRGTRWQKRRADDDEDDGEPAVLSANGGRTDRARADTPP